MRIMPAVLFVMFVAACSSSPPAAAPASRAAKAEQPITISLDVGGGRSLRFVVETDGRMTGARGAFARLSGDTVVDRDQRVILRVGAGGVLVAGDGNAVTTEGDPWRLDGDALVLGRDRVSIDDGGRILDAGQPVGRVVGHDPRRPTRVLVAYAGVAMLIRDAVSRKLIEGLSETYASETR